MAKTSIDVPSEYRKSKSATKEVFYYKDPEYGIDQISREVFLKADKINHYPTPYRGNSKYTNIKKFSYWNFNDKLPAGVYKVSTFGYGFTKALRSIGEYLDRLGIQEIIIVKGGTDHLDLVNHILQLSDNSLAHLHSTFSDLLEKHKKEKEVAAQHHLNILFPANIAPVSKNYTAGALAYALSHWSNAMDDFNAADKQAIKDLFDKLTLLPNFFSETNLAKTKEIIDNKFINGALSEFDKMLTLTADTPTLEKKWQKFLKDHSWIFSTLFAQPVILHQDEAYVGGKTLDNKDGKYNDFLLKSGLGGNVSFVEIKTHLTFLMEDRPYRGSDVFAPSKELAGCLGQVLNQRDYFQKEYYRLAYKQPNIQTFNSKAMVIVGQYVSLSAYQQSAFELLRSNSKDVEIVTFDELRSKIHSLLAIMAGKAITNQSKK